MQEALKGHADIKIVEIFDIKDDPARSVEIIATGRPGSYADLGAWISVGGWPLFTPKALDPVDSKRTQLIAFETAPAALEVMKAGKVQVLIGPKYFGWGSEAVKLLADIKAGKPPGPTGHRLRRGRRHPGQPGAVRGELGEAPEALSHSLDGSSSGAVGSWRVAVPQAPPTEVS